MKARANISDSTWAEIEFSMDEIGHNESKRELISSVFVHSSMQL